MAYFPGVIVCYAQCELMNTASDLNAVTLSLNTGYMCGAVSGLTGRQRPVKAIICLHQQ